MSKSNEPANAVYGSYRAITSPIMEDANDCGRCGKPWPVRHGADGTHLRCGKCGWDSAEYWPKGAVSPEPKTRDAP